MRVRIRTQLLLLLIIVLVVTFAQLPGNTMLWQELQNTGHTVAFVAIAVLVLGLLERIGSNTSRKKWITYVLAFFYCACIAVITELVQWGVNSDASIKDLIRDFAGVIIAITLVYGFLKQGKDIRKKLAAILTGLVVSIASLFPLTVTALAYHERNKAFPVLLDPTSGWSAQFIASESAAAEKSEFETVTGKYGKIYKVGIGSGIYPGISVKEVVPDWSGFKHIVFEIYSRQDEAIDLVIRINDIDHNQEYSDRFNRNITVNKGYNRYLINLETVFESPAGRRMEVRNMNKIIIFAVVPKADEKFYLARISLV